MRVVPQGDGPSVGERFRFDQAKELVVVEGLLTGEYPRIKMPEVPILGSTLLGHVVQPGDRYIAEVGEGSKRQFKVVPLKLPGVLLATDPARDRGVIDAENSLIPLVEDPEAFTGLLDTIRAAGLIKTREEAKSVAERVGNGHQLLLHYRNSGLIRAYIEDSFPGWEPTQEPSHWQPPERTIAA